MSKVCSMQSIPADALLDCVSNGPSVGIGLCKLGFSSCSVFTLYHVYMDIMINFVVDGRGLLYPK